MEKFPKQNEWPSEKEKEAVERKNEFLKTFLKREPTEEEKVLLQRLIEKQNKDFLEWMKNGRLSLLDFQKHWGSQLLNKKEKPEFLDTLQQSLVASTLIDLGGGEPVIGGEGKAMVKIARESKVGKYITVDRNLLGGASVDSNKVLGANFDYYTKLDTENTEVLTIQADMLDFVSKIPDNSANFVLNGIDSNVISNKEYVEELAKQIIRATKPGGLIWGMSSAVEYYLEESDELEVVRIQPEEDSDGEEFCFKKQ